MIHINTDTVQDSTYEYGKISFGTFKSLLFTVSSNSKTLIDKYTRPTGCSPVSNGVNDRYIDKHSFTLHCVWEITEHPYPFSQSSVDFRWNVSLQYLALLFIGFQSHKLNKWDSFYVREFDYYSPPTYSTFSENPRVKFSSFPQTL